MTNDEIIEAIRKGNAKEIARQTGIPYDRMAKWTQGKGQPKKADADTLEAYFKGTTSTERNGNSSMTVNESTPTYGNRVPFYDVDAMAGFDNVDMMPVTESYKTIDVGDLLSDSECAIRIYGNSMVPNYPSGCVVGLREVKDGIVEYGNVYVIETEDNRYLKRLLKDADGKGYVCYSDNVMRFADGPRTGDYYYEPFVVPFEKINRLYRVTGVIKRNSNSPIFGSRVN